MHPQRWRWRNKFLISYIIIFLIPILGLGACTVLVSTKALTEESIRSNYQALHKFASVVDTQIENINRIPAHLSTSNTMIPMTLETNPFQVLCVQKELRKLVLTNDFINDLFVYFYGDHYLISPTTSASLADFKRVMYDYEHWSAEEMYADLNRPLPIQVRGEEPVRCYGRDTQQMITFIYPVRYLYGKPYVSIMMQVEKDRIAKLLDMLGFASNAEFVMRNRDGQILTAFMHGQHTVEEALDQIKPEQPTGIMKLSGRWYGWAQTQSVFTGILYDSIVPMADLLGGVNRMLLAFCIVLCLLTGFAGLLIFFFLRHNYLPIQNLRQFAETLSSVEVDGNAWAKDELQQIRQSLEMLNTKNLALQSQVKSSRETLRDSLIFDLIRGGVHSVAQFNQAGAGMGLQLEEGFYAVALLYCNAFNEELIDRVMRVTEDFATRCHMFAHRHLDRRKIVLLLNFSTQPGARLLELLKELHDQLCETFSIAVTIGLGNTYHEIDYMPKSFLEADTAVDYRLVQGRNRVIVFKDCLVSDESARMLQSLHANHIQAYLKAGDYAATECFLNRMEERINHASMPIFMVKSVCFDMIQEIRKITNSAAGMQPQTTDLFHLMGYDNVSELFAALKQICRDVCQAAVENHLCDETSKIGQMIQYIEESYSQPDFSTDRMAELFDLSSPALCQYFKQQTGKTVTDYLVGFRIAQAKKLLASTDYHMAQISSEVGYYNVSSFIRRFKQMTGMPPGEYREKWHGDAENGAHPKSKSIEIESR